MIYWLSIIGINLWWMSKVPWSKIPYYATVAGGYVWSWAASLNPVAYLIAACYIGFVVAVGVKLGRGDFTQKKQDDTDG